MPTQSHTELCGRMMVPESDRMARIFEILGDETDAKLLLTMPGTLVELAGKMGLDESETKEKIDELFHRGVVFESEKPQGTVYKMARHIIQLHDASVQWPEATQEFYDTWKAFMNQEFPVLLKMMLGAGIPAFMRVIPASGTLENMPGVLAYEDVFQMIDATQDLAVVRCPCRVSEKLCDAPVETCIQFDRGASYNIKRGTGRAISKDEAKQIVRDCEERGLVHTVETRPGLGNVLCNCCTDCCAIIKPYLRGKDFEPILAPSRYLARVVPDMCTMDELCADICPVKAIRMDDDEESAAITEETCIGCGLCVSQCPSGALSLVQVKPADFI